MSILPLGSNAASNRADWQLPEGVSRSLWEYAADDRIAVDEDEHVRESVLHRVDLATVAAWFSTPGRVADLGCGSGRAVRYLAARKFAVTAIDLSWPALRIGREKLRAAGNPSGVSEESGLHPAPIAAAAVATAVAATSDKSTANTGDTAGAPVHWMRGNLCDLGFLADGSHDYALLLFGTLGMIHGARERLKVLQEARRILVAGGQIVAHVHRIWGHAFHPAGRKWLMHDVWRRMTGRSDAGDSVHLYRGIPGMYHHAFSDRELRRLFRDAGFRCLNWLPVYPLSLTEIAGSPSAHETPDVTTHATTAAVPLWIGTRPKLPLMPASGWMIQAIAE